MSVDELPPLLGADDDPVALPHAPTLAAFSPQAPPEAPAAYAPAPARRIAPIEPIGIESLEPPPIEQIDPFADEPVSPPVARAAAPAPVPSAQIDLGAFEPSMPSPPRDLPSFAPPAPPPSFAPSAPPPPELDLGAFEPSMPSPPRDLPTFSPPAPEPPARPAPVPRAPPPAAASPRAPAEPAPMTSGEYSISRGAAVVEGEGPSSMREDMRVPAGKPRPAPAPARPRKHSGEQPAVVVERVRPGGIVTETQRIKAHHLHKEGKDE